MMNSKFRSGWDHPQLELIYFRSKSWGQAARDLKHWVENDYCRLHDNLELIFTGMHHRVSESRSARDFVQCNFGVKGESKILHFFLHGNEVGFVRIEEFIESKQLVGSSRFPLCSFEKFSTVQEALTWGRENPHFYNPDWNLFIEKVMDKKS